MYQGRFTWKIEHFTRLKELLKKRKITGMCVKSRCFQVGGRECRLIIYPRGGCWGPAGSWTHQSHGVQFLDGACSPGLLCSRAAMPVHTSLPHDAQLGAAASLA